MSISNISDVESLLQRSPTVRELYSAWDARRPLLAMDRRKAGADAITHAIQVPWLDDTVLAREFIAHALRRDEFLLVVDAAREVLSTWPNASEDDKTNLIRVRMDYAKALMRLGFMSQARAAIEACVAPDFQPPLGRRLRADLYLLLGDASREEWHCATDAPSQITAAKDALHYYAQALALDPTRLEALSFTALIAFVLRSRDDEFGRQSRETANRILKLTAELEDSDGRTRRTLRAEATARAVLGEEDAAFKAFEQLRTLPDITTADLAEARFQARLLAEALGKPRDHFKQAFPPLQLIVFSGHAPDRPGEPVRFPHEAIPRVRDELEQTLSSIEARVGLVSASAGADLLFADAILKRDGTLHLVLPWAQDEFRRTSVRPYEPAEGPPLWEALYDQALKAAATTREIGHFYDPGSDVGWEFSMEVTAGIALLTARALRLDIQPLVLWDGLPGRGAGGTDSFHQLWKEKLKKEPIRLQALTSPAMTASTRRFKQRSERSILHQEVKSMLFADIVGYSKLSEKAIPDFINVFLRRLDHLAATSRHAPVNVNTWGDAIYAVFDHSHDAGWFALELVQMIEDGRRDWLDKGLYWETASEGGVLQNPLNIRIGLHTGPVTMHFDPVVRRLGFTGAHVNRAARIEPIAEPGQVFASEEFAAMIELVNQLPPADGRHPAKPGSQFVCEYAGSMQLAKGYPGRYRIYRVSVHRLFAIEALAKAVHEDYCEQSRQRGEAPQTNSSLRPWQELTEDARNANRAQATDIANKLRVMNLELTGSGGLSAAEITIPAEQLEKLAMREHTRWMEERKASGWTYAALRDNARKHHPMLVPWDLLPEVEREKDRDVIRLMPKLIDKAGFRVKLISNHQENEDQHDS
jgi:class 3 adenylate cyclase/tetratricopeptide (TPR) repeat protein